MPITLGCCPDTPRCVLCPPPSSTDPETVRALIDLYRQDRCQAGQSLIVRFFGGSPPSADLLEAASPHPIEIRVRPDLLTQQRARELRSAGVQAIEVDALTLQNRSLREAGRHYRRRRILEMLEGLRALDFRVGIVLAPGLPGTDFDTSLDDAMDVREHVDTARLHPVLVLNRSGLKTLHMEGRYRPLKLGEAVTVCRAMMDILEAGDVQVLRVGLQPGPDGFGKAVAGPRHSSLRELVECRRMLDHLRSVLDETTSGTHIEIKCCPADVSRVRGPLNQHVRTLRAEFQLTDLDVTADEQLKRGHVQVKGSEKQ